MFTIDKNDVQYNKNKGSTYLAVGWGGMVFGTSPEDNAEMNN